jgi:hypothetical protein
VPNIQRNLSTETQRGIWLRKKALSRGFLEIGVGMEALGKDSSLCEWVERRPLWYEKALLFWGGDEVGNKAEIESVVRASPSHQPRLGKTKALWGAKAPVHLL